MILRIEKNKLILLFILFLSLSVRVWRYDSFPVAGESKDEFAWTWLGESLLSGNPPTSWSWFEGYTQVEEVVLGGMNFRIVSPTFDNPPLFSLIPGAAAKLFGYSGIVIPSIRVIRLPLIVLGVINVWLLYVFVLKMSDVRRARLAALIYATVPTFVFASRLVVAENLLVTWLLLLGIVLMTYSRQPKKRWLGIIGLIAGLGMLTKVSGVILVCVAVFWFFWQKKYTEAAIVGIVAFLVGSLWLVYALAFGMDTFLRVQLLQASLPVGWGSVINLFIRNHVVDKPIFDGWNIFGMLALFVYMTGAQSVKRLWLPSLVFIFWILFHISAVGEQNWHGWYKYPLFPLMSYAIADLWYRIPHFASVWMVTLLGILPTLRLILYDYSFPPAWLSRSIIVLMTVVVLTLILKRSPSNWHALIRRLTLVIMIVVNVFSIYTLNATLLSEDFLRFFPYGY